jgi:hypothetical protein
LNLLAAGAAVKFRTLILIFMIVLGGCRYQAVNPPRLIMDSETDATIQLFVQASILMAQAYGFQTVRYEDIQLRSERAGFRTIPFMPPDTIRMTPRYIQTIQNLQGPAIAAYIMKDFGAKPLVKYYIRTGLRASQLICRNHLIRLDEGNQYQRQDAAAGNSARFSQLSY